MLDLKGQYQDINLKHDKLLTDVESLEKGKKSFLAQLADHQREMTDLIAENEKYKREIFTKV